MAAVLGMSFEYLDALPAAEVPLYGVAALDHRATDLRRQCDLFLLPAEAIGGGKMQTLKRLNAEMCRMSGTEADEHADNPFAEIEAEIMHNLAAANFVGNQELVEHYEKLYALRAQEILKRQRQDRLARLQAIEAGTDERILEAFRKRATHAPAN